MKYYDIKVLYHPGKSNLVADALGCMTMGSVSHLEKDTKDLVKYFHRLVRLGVRLEYSPNGGFMVHYNYELSLVVKVKSKQHHDPLFME